MIIDRDPGDETEHEPSFFKAREAFHCPRSSAVLAELARIDAAERVLAEQFVRARQAAVQSDALRWPFGGPRKPAPANIAAFRL